MNTTDQITPIDQTIADLVQSVPGWSPPDQLQALFHLTYFASALQGDIVEIGSWCGRSALVFGLATRLANDATCVHCIDLFPEKDDWLQNEDGSYSFSVVINDRIHQAYHQQTVWEAPFESDIAPVYDRNSSILDIFKQNIATHQLEDKIKPFRGDSGKFVQEIDPDFQCKLAFVDGHHSYEAVCADIQNLEPFLVPGGWFCFDDAFSSYDGVNKAIETCILANPNYDLCQQLTRKLFVARKKVQR